mgnify:CR=1 FL=1
MLLGGLAELQLQLQPKIDVGAGVRIERTDEWKGEWVNGSSLCHT